MPITKLHSQRILDAPQSGDMERQAIINGNFDIWQRTTSAANFTTSSYAATDRWIYFREAGGGSLPTTTTFSRQNLTPGDIPGSNRYHRFNTDSSSSLGATGEIGMQQRIEGGTRYLCGAGKQVTLSFWARSDIVSEVIGVHLTQYYGTGGSPSATEQLVGTTYTLTSNWTKYTYTFTTNTLSGKTLGTSLNDWLGVKIDSAWGSTFASRFGSSGTNDMGTGNVDIAQVQLCAGSEALPFEPKNPGDEQEACQRYFYAMKGQGGIYYESAFSRTTTNTVAIISYPKMLRVNPTFSANGAGSDYTVIYRTSNTTCTVVPVNLGSTRFSSYISFTTAAVQTQGEGTQILAGTSSAGLLWDAEL